MTVGIGFVVASVALLIYFGRRDSTRQEVPQSDRPADHSEVLLGAGTNALTILAATNRQIPPAPVPALLGTNLWAPQTDEDRVVALVGEGNELLEQGKYAEAADRFEQGISIGGNDEDLHYNLAIAFAKLGKVEAAKQHYTQALDLFPEYAEAHNNLGNLLLNEMKPAEALEHFRAAVEIRPDDPSFRNNLGTALALQWQSAEAIAEFSEAIKLKPDYLQARVNLANAYLSAGELDQAAVQLNEALHLRPDFGPALQAVQRLKQKQASIARPE